MFASPKFIRVLAIFICAIIFSSSAQAQYILNGSAVKNTCNCYTLTPEVNTQSGSVWNSTKINLNNPFNFIFNVYLGCKDLTGADGIAFILQPISTSVGTTGGGLGFEGIVPSVGVVLDTWQNLNNNDPDYDHIAIQANGNLTHGSDLAGPIQASPTNPNIEDCQWHTLRIIWDPATRSLRTYFDGYFMLESTADIINTIFNGDPMVYWGFSAGTGGSNNLQQFCTALNPNFNATTPTNSSCFGNPITFTNTSQSFASIVDFYWDFGDGFTSTVANPPPHNYAAPGKYDVKLAITALDGCKSDTMKKTIIVGDYPVANFIPHDTCSGLTPRVDEQSTVTIGTVSTWNWYVDGGTTPAAVTQQPVIPNLSSGPHQLTLVAASNYGCTSSPLTKTINIIPTPLISARAANGCLNFPVNLFAEQIDNATAINSWDWVFGDNSTANQQNPQHTFNGLSPFTAQVIASAGNGCKSLPVNIVVPVSLVTANAGRDTIIVQNVPYQTQSTATITGNTTSPLNYQWTPSIGLDDPFKLNPLITLSDDQQYYFKVTSADGCVGKDTLNITVFKGSSIWVPTGFTPDGNGLNDVLRPVLYGIKTLDFFVVYNRWGEKVFSTNQQGVGWDGKVKGMKQATATYVWMLKATDYAGKVYQMKGSSTIIR
jgi:gliding motility-associated-like protein